MMRVPRLFLAVIWVFLASGLAVQAQLDDPDLPETPALVAVIGPDYTDWKLTADRVEQLSRSGNGSDFALQRLRADLVVWREEFVDAEGLNDGRIGTVQAQIEALGPSPEGHEEAAAIVARRDALQAQLSALQVPVLLAQEARAHANGLISEIDALLRDTRTSTFTNRGLSPLNPGIWPEAAEVIEGRFVTLYREATAKLTSDNLWRQNAATIGQSALLVLIGLWLIIRGRTWSLRLQSWAKIEVQSEAALGVWRFLTSLMQIALPLAGLYGLQLGLDSSGLLGLAGQEIANALPQAGLFIIIARWLGDQLSLAATANHPFLDLRQVRRGNASKFILRTGWVLGIGELVDALLATGEASPAATAVALLPIQLLLAYLLFRIGRVLLGAGGASDTTQTDQPRFRRRIFGFVGRVVIVIAAVGPVLAFAGYSNATEALILPSVMTLALLAISLLLQGFVTDIYSLSKGGSEGSRDALVPVLFGFALTLLAMPVLALIWGASVQDLTEVWASFREGYSFGENRVSPTDFLTFAIVFAVGYMLTRLLQGALRSSVLPKTRIDKGAQNAIVAGIGYVGIFLAAIIAISSAGLDLSSLAIVAGALSVGIGFGLQNIVSNFVAGIILLIERPISEGDWIEVGGQMGYVRAISVRSTRIETFDRTDVIVPNADLVSGQVTNWTRGNSVGRVIVPVGVAYGTDVAQVKEILTEIATGNPMVVLTPPPSVLFINFGADSLDFEIRAILRDVNFVMAVKSEMNFEINARFAQAGIEIPFAQRDLWLRNPEVLAQRGEGSET